MSKDLEKIVQFCDERTSRKEFVDFPGAENGLQITNNGKVTKVGSAVDAGIEEFRKATSLGIDFLIVHHGLFWNPPVPMVGAAYAKLKMAMDGNLAVYGSHLPLDKHSEIGNNALIAKRLELRVKSTIFPHEGMDIGLLAEGIRTRQALRESLENLFPRGFKSIEFGSEDLGPIAILSGSGNSAVGETLRSSGTDTLITGELRQHHFTIAQELGLNLYACGHHATETFGVDALGQEVAATFALTYEFIDSDCPL